MAVSSVLSGCQAETTPEMVDVAFAQAGLHPWMKERRGEERMIGEIEPELYCIALHE